MNIKEQSFRVSVTDRETGTQTEHHIVLVTDEKVLKDNDETNLLLHRLVRETFGPVFAITKVNKIEISEETIFDLPIDRN